MAPAHDAIKKELGLRRYELANRAPRRWPVPRAVRFRPNRRFSLPAVKDWIPVVIIAAFSALGAIVAATIAARSATRRASRPDPG